MWTARSPANGRTSANITKTKDEDAKRLREKIRRAAWLIRSDYCVVASRVYCSGSIQRIADPAAAAAAALVCRAHYSESPGNVERLVSTTEWPRAQPSRHAYIHYLRRRQQLPPQHGSTAGAAAAIFSPAAVAERHTIGADDTELVLVAILKRTCLRVVAVGRLAPDHPARRPTAASRLLAYLSANLVDTGLQCATLRHR